jgi:hypothetical protein
MKDTPIIINNFNRLSSTRNMREFLIQRGFTNVVILDNNSTYAPLLDWYATLTDKEVVRFNENFGSECLFKSGYINSIESEYIVYSDSDLELNPLMPDDFLEEMKAMMLKYHENKIGLALKIDDVPADCYKNCFSGSINWEKQFWINRLEEHVYKAMVDTTFSLLHKPVWHDYNAIRIAGNFTARHLPWYLRYNEINEEELYYITHANTQSNFRNGYFTWQNQQLNQAV